MAQEPLDDRELPGRMIELSHGAFLYLAIDILRVRLILRGAQVDLQRHEGLVHEDIVSSALVNHF
jgi:hypothetical protein